MKFFVVLTSFLLASLSMANDDQAHERENRLMLIDEAAAANQQVLTQLEGYRDKVDVALAALGAEAKTVAEWREQWTHEGKTGRIARYLTGKDDDASIWFLDNTKADLDKMAELGMGHIRVEYIEHWQMFNKLANKRNMLTRQISEIRSEQLALEIKNMRKRIADMNCSLDEMRKDVKKMRKKVKKMKRKVGRMLAEIRGQNLGLKFIIAYHEAIIEAIIEGLNGLDQAEQGLGEG